MPVDRVVNDPDSPKTPRNGDLVMRFLSYLSALVVATATVSPVLAGDREYWRHNAGHFENTSGNSWTEKNTTNEFQFVETDRTHNYVELFDAGRNCTVRLYANACFVKAPFTNNQFKKYYNGKWGSN